MTELTPVWDLSSPKYPPKYICDKCKPIKFGVKFAKKTDWAFINKDTFEETEEYKNASPIMKTEFRIPRKLEKLLE